MTFGERLRRAREAKGWTQTNLAENSGAFVSGKDIDLLELDRVYPTVHHVIAFCDALDISADELLGRKR